MNKEALEHRPPLQSMADTLVGPEFWYGTSRAGSASSCRSGFCSLRASTCGSGDRGRPSLWPLPNPRPDTDEAAQALSGRRTAVFLPWSFA